jgi:hypothetical protein
MRGLRCTAATCQAGTLQPFAICISIFILSLDVEMPLGMDRRGLAGQWPDGG